MPNTIDIIGDDALIDQIISKTITEIEDDAILKVGYSAFRGCADLTSVKLTAATSIGNNAFGGCYALASVNLPAVTSIDTNAFSYCTRLASIKLPAVTSIGMSFPDCAKLTDIYLSAKEGEISGAPWGATRATIHYEYDFSQDGGE